MTPNPLTADSPYGYKLGATRIICVVNDKGWKVWATDGHPDSLWEEDRYPEIITSALGVCGAGLDRAASPEGPDPEKDEKWCRACTDPAYREAIRTRY